MNTFFKLTQEYEKNNPTGTIYIFYFSTFAMDTLSSSIHFPPQPLRHPLRTFQCSSEAASCVTLLKAFAFSMVPIVLPFRADLSHLGREVKIFMVFPMQARSSQFGPHQGHSTLV